MSHVRGRNAGLDALRVLAALLVVAFHLRVVSGVQFGPLDPLVQGGDSGVYIFFALSGYLLYRPFLMGPVDLRSFALKRAARILPGYFVALTGLMVLTGSPLPVDNPLPFLTMSASYDIPLRGFLGNAWTLSAEILFYVSLPILAALVRGREGKLLAALAFASFLAGVVYAETFSPAAAWLIGTYPLVFYSFVPGMLVAVLEVTRPEAFARLGGWPALVAGIALIGGGAAVRTIPMTLLSGAGTALLIGWLLHHRLPGAKYLVFAGGASYALYLWHKDAFIAFGPIGGLLIAVVASALSWVIVERPTLDTVHAYVRRQRVIAPNEPAPGAASSATAA